MLNVFNFCVILGCGKMLTSPVNRMERNRWHEVPISYGSTTIRKQQKIITINVAKKGQQTF
jgi:hypothetical protein